MCLLFIYMLHFMLCDCGILEALKVLSLQGFASILEPNLCRIMSQILTIY
ncbi:hypothetical protein RchiOBHm_Chr7g0214661 [Rosa chinensis]|uniref:Uncharacterized protein n=1 Tax=Rosa chinensis TaxID=74649 RepID=A0A2P6PBA4_ROSCH|nr:hypothetical protein RchiOBHm_Chr7g0214661 [Rosa chinensis]